MPLEAISPSAIHNLNAVERSQDEQGSSYPNSYRHQHPRHVASLRRKGNTISLLPPLLHCCLAVKENSLPRIKLLFSGGESNRERDDYFLEISNS